MVNRMIELNPNINSLLKDYKIKPNIVIPVHYNSIVGSKKDEQVFISKLNKDIKYQILI